MAQKSERQRTGEDLAQPAEERLVWLKAAYRFHTFSYRDPRSAYSSAPGLPVVSPTTVLLGIASTLFGLGKAEDARAFLNVVHTCRAIVDAPDGAVFFRAFHQSRRYVTGANKTKKEDYKPNPRLGLTDIAQAVREHALVDGTISLFVQVPHAVEAPATVGLRHLPHLGAHDSLCSLVGDVETCSEPQEVVYMPPEEWRSGIRPDGACTFVMLSRFKGKPLKPTVGQHWWMSDGESTERVPYLVEGSFVGTSGGKLYRKHGSL